MHDVAVVGTCDVTVVLYYVCIWITVCFAAEWAYVVYTKCSSNRLNLQLLQQSITDCTVTAANISLTVLHLQELPHCIINWSHVESKILFRYASSWSSRTIYHPFPLLTDYYLIDSHIYSAAWNHRASEWMYTVTDIHIYMYISKRTSATLATRTAPCI